MLTERANVLRPKTIEKRQDEKGSEDQHDANEAPTPSHDVTPPPPPLPTEDEEDEEQSIMVATMAAQVEVQLSETDNPDVVGPATETATLVRRSAAGYTAYTCSICERKFERQSSLARHLTLHQEWTFRFDESEYALQHSRRNRTLIFVG